MENLIHDLIHRLETVKLEEKVRIFEYKENGVDDAAKILTGKIMALDYCIHELQRMASYAHQAEINH
jgi:hypothetical protein